jgi:hypothetical protein
VALRFNRAGGGFAQVHELDTRLGWDGRPPALGLVRGSQIPDQPGIWQAIEVIPDEIRHSSIDADRRRDSLAAEAFWRAYVPAGEDRDSPKKDGQPLI